MTERKCMFIANLDGGSAEDLRLLNSAAIGGEAFTPVTPGVGMIARGHGVLTGAALKVTAQGSPNNTVAVAKGSCAIRGSQSPTQGSYIVNNDASTNVTIGAKDVNYDRYDYVVVQLRDSGYSAFSGNDFQLTTLEGTPGGGYPAITHDCLVLASVKVTHGTGSTVITTSDITDLRPQTRATGGITPVNSRSDLPNPQPYEAVWEYSTEQLLIYTGTTWVVFGNNQSAAWSTYTPTLGGVSLGASGTRYGRVKKYGRTVTGIAGFNLGGTGSVTGSITMRLPSTMPAYNAGPNFVYMVAVKAKIGSVHYSATAEIAPSYDPTLIFNFATAGTSAWKPAIPTTWTNTSSVKIWFLYEAAAA